MDLIKVKLAYNRFFSSRVLLSTVAVMLSITQVGCSYTSRNLHIIEQGGIQSCGGYLVHVNPLYAYNVKNPLCKPSRTYAYDKDKREREREEGTIGAMQQIDKIYNRIIGLS